MTYPNKNTKTYFLNTECYYIQDYICAYLSNDLNDIEKKNLENHLKKCSACSFEYESLVEFKKEIQKSICDKDIQKLFKKNNEKVKYVRNKKLFENFLTLVFVTVIVTSIGYLMLDLVKIIK